MKKDLFAIIGIAAALTACESKEETLWSEFEQIEFVADGIELSDKFEFPDGHTDFMTCGACVPADGTTFTLTGTGKHADEAYVSYVRLVQNQEFTEIKPLEDLPKGIRPTDDNIPCWKGDWGSVEYLTTTAPYTVKVTLTPNQTPTLRTLIITFSGAYTTTRVALSQPSL